MILRKLEPIPVVIFASMREGFFLLENGLKGKADACVCICMCGYSRKVCCQDKGIHVVEVYEETGRLRDFISYMYFQLAEEHVP